MTQLNFRNYAGSYQLKIKNAEDLEKVQELDEVHWAAVSIPTNSLHCDKTFLACVDTDKNGRIRPAEFKRALSWMFQVLSDRGRLSEGSDVLRLQDIDTERPEGQKLRTAAELILTNLNLPEANEISLVQIRDVQSIMASAANNGDGIIPPEVTSDTDLAGFISSVMDTVGSQTDACGKQGISEEELKEFFHEAEAYLSWKTKGDLPKNQESTEIMPWGTDTPASYELVKNVEGKIDQFFAQCSLVKFDGKIAARIQLHGKKLEEIDLTDTSKIQSWLKDSSLAFPNPNELLNFEGEINPQFISCLLELKEKVLKRALGDSLKELSVNEWDKVKRIFGSYRMWLESKQGDKVEKLGSDLLRSYLKGSFREKASELIKKDLLVADDLNQIHNLEKLILYQKWLMILANNFVSFEDLYNPNRRALFEMGTLIIDKRQITFTMGVEDYQAHKKVSEKSSMYLLYVKVSGRQDEEITFEIVAPVTSGGAGGLCIGKRGIFFSVDGHEWDAEVMDIVVNPISVLESVKAPFQNVSGFMKKQINKISKSSEDKLVTTDSSTSASSAARDLMLGGGLAIAALGSSFAYITKALSEVNLVQVLLSLLGLAMIILIPGIIAGVTKIRKRDMSKLLEASGWAVNVHMRVNTAMGRLFTRAPYLPKGARKERRDTVSKFLKEFTTTSSLTKPASERRSSAPEVEGGH